MRLSSPGFKRYVIYVTVLLEADLITKFAYFVDLAEQIYFLQGLRQERLQTMD